MIEWGPRAALRRMPASAGVVLALLAGAACGSDDAAVERDRPLVVVTTAVWGDIVAAAVGAAADVEVVMPAGADPHDFAPSARQAETMERADLLVANGLGLEEGMLDIIEAVRDGGTTVFDVAAELGLDGESTSAGDDDGDDHESDHDHGPVDPHLWLDPQLVVDAVEALGDRLAADADADAAVLEDAVSAYVESLRELDREIGEMLADVAPDDRELVTDHDSFGHFAERYGFETLGSIVGSTSTGAGASASDLSDLAALVRERDVRAIVVESTESDQLARAVADEAGNGAEIVVVFVGSPGDPDSGADTYVTMMRENARRLTTALTR